MRNLLALVAALATLALAAPASAQLPCGPIAPQSVETNSTVTSTLPIDTISVLFSLTDGGPASSTKTVAAPAPEPDGSYTVTQSSSAFTNNVTFYVATRSHSAAGTGPDSNWVVVPASISGECPPITVLNSATPVP